MGPDSLVPVEIDGEVYLSSNIRKVVQGDALRPFLEGLAEVERVKREMNGGPSRHQEPRRGDSRGR